MLFLICFKLDKSARVEDYQPAIDIMRSSYDLACDKSRFSSVTRYERRHVCEGKQKIT